MEVKFKFFCGQKVKSGLGDIGYITTASVDRSGIKAYYIKIVNGVGQWFDEDQLEAHE
jgi:hypothetical protein